MDQIENHMEPSNRSHFVLIGKQTLIFPDKVLEANVHLVLSRFFSLLLLFSSNNYFMVFLCLFLSAARFPRNCRLMYAFLRRITLHMIKT